MPGKGRKRSASGRIRERDGSREIGGPEATDPGARRRRVPARSAGRGGLVLAVLAVFLAAGVPLRAQEQTDTTRTPADSVAYALEGITVEASRPTTAAGGASAVEVRLDSMAVTPSATMGEVLREMPLVRVRRNSRGQQQPSLRGMEERQVAILVEGVPITLGWDNRTDLSVVPLNAAREVTMIRGLSSVLAGPNVLGGVVMVGITEGARPEMLRNPFRARLGLEHTGAVSVEGEGGVVRHPGHSTLLVRAGGGLRDSPGLDRPGGVRSPGGDDDLLVNTDYASRNGFVSARWWGRGGEWVSLSSLAFDAEKGVLPELHIDEPRLWRIPEQWRSLTAVSAGTGWRDTPFGQGDLEASVGIDVGHLEIDAFDSFAYRDSVGGQTDDDRTVTVRLLADHTLGSGMLRGAFTWAEARHEQREEGSPELAYEQRLWSVGGELEQPVGGFLDGVPFLSRATLNIGASADGSTTPETGDKPPREGIDGWGGRVVGSFHVGGGAARIHGGVSRKVRFPALRELFSGALGKFEPNPGLGPEVLKVGELGVTGSIGGAETQLTVFQQRLEGAIVRAATDDGKLRRENRDEIRSTGVEVMANWRLRSLSVGAELTLQDVEVRQPGASAGGTRPEYQPEIITGVRLNAPLAYGFRGRASLEHEGRQFCVNPDTGLFDRIDPNVSVDVGVSRTLPRGIAGLPGMSVSVSASNLTDETVWEQCGIPAAGRTLQIRLQVL